MGLVFLNQWLGLHLRWFFSNYVSGSGEMSRGEVVKSAYMLDPSDGVSLIRRDEAGPNIDKEYWQRVNQVENIF